MNFNVVDHQNLNKFNSNIKNNDFAVWFYADWCGHCKSMENEWKVLESKCKNKYNLAKVRDDMKDGVMNGLGKDVQGFPKIVLISNGKQINEYNGERNNEKLLKFIEGNMSKNNSNNNTKGTKKTKGKKKTKAKAKAKAKSKKNSINNFLRGGRRRTKRNNFLNKVLSIVR